MPSGRRSEPRRSAAARAHADRPRGSAATERAAPSASALHARRPVRPAARRRRRPADAECHPVLRDGRADARDRRGAAGADLSLPPARGTLRRAADAAGPRRGLAVPRRPGLRRAHPRMAQDAAQEERLRHLRHASLADIAGSSIAPAIIESCPSRIFLPNDRAIEPQAKAVYEASGSTTGRSRSSRGRHPSATTTTSRATATGCSISTLVPWRSPLSAAAPSKTTPSWTNSSPPMAKRSSPTPGCAPRISTGQPS